IEHGAAVFGARLLQHLTLHGAAGKAMLDLEPDLVRDAARERADAVHAVQSQLATVLAVAIFAGVAVQLATPCRVGPADQHIVSWGRRLQPENVFGTG